MTSILTDENFEKEIQSIDKLILVDFFATWCGPCFVLTPILEKIADDLKDKIVLVKVDLDNIPFTAQKFGIDRIPTVVLFKSGKPISGFIGLRTEEFIKEWLENTIKQNDNARVHSLQPEDNIQERIEELNKWYTNYAKENGFNLNPNKEIVQRLMRGLLENEKKHGQRYCPCRRVTGDKEVDAKSVCPCYYHRDEIEKNGHCFCGLFVR